MAKIIDPMGLPAGGGNREPTMRFDPVLGLLWPAFMQAMHDLTTTQRDDGIGLDSASVPALVVETAWDIANRAFNKLGFEFVFPAGAKVLSKPEENPQ